MKNPKIQTSKYMLLAFMLIALLALSGCRTRITNNSDVSNVHYDGEGLMSELYEMRRDELGLSIAEKPILPDFGTPDEESEEPDATDENLNITPEEDTYVEPPTTTEAERTTNESTRRSSRGSSGTVSNEKTYRVTLDPNSRDGRVDDRSKGSIISMPVPEDSEIVLPGATRDGYVFKGWKRKSDGNVHEEGASIEVTKDEYFTAEWQKEETPKPEAKKYEVTFLDGQGNTLSEQMVEEGKAAKEPAEPLREGYDFTGWDKDFRNVRSKLIVTAQWKKVNIQIILDGNGKAKTTSEEAENGKYRLPVLDDIRFYYFDGWNEAADGSGESYKAGKTITITESKTLYAQWKSKQKEDYWNDRFDDEVEKTAQVVKFQLIGAEDSKIIQECAAENSDDPTVQIKIVDEWKAEGDEWGSQAEDGLDPSKTRILISKDTFESSDSNKQLMLMIKLFNILHDGDMDEEAAAEELGINLEDIQIEKL